MSKSKKPPICDICHQNEAIWAEQIIGGELNFYALGWHIRGWKVTKVCDACRELTREIDATQDAAASRTQGE